MEKELDKVLLKSVKHNLLTQKCEILRKYTDVQYEVIYFLSLK